MKDSLQLGTLFSMQYKMLKAIPVVFEKTEDGQYIAAWQEALEWGIGDTRSCAIKDLTSSIKETYYELSQAEALGSDLERVKQLMEEHFRRKK